MPGAQTSSGAASAPRCSPPVDQGAPAPTGPVRDAVADAVPRPNPYNTPAQAAHSPAYGYPQQAGYRDAGPSPYAQQQGASTPPPSFDALRPGFRFLGRRQEQAGDHRLDRGRRRGRRRALVGALLMNGGGDEDPEAGGGGTASVSASPSKAAGYRGPDKTKTIEKDKCTEPRRSVNGPDKIKVPDFTFKYIGSVKECFNAAGWRMKVVEVDENTYGEGSIRDQFPTAGTDVDPENMPEIQLGLDGQPAVRMSPVT
ncbi:non-specific serine/threonine protein kinase OS=Streptomyces tendae OX=1932 GN=GUR47_20740 PE=4 SV=1 [Streptomyces tendae]